MDNLYFGLTKPELNELVAGGDQGAQAELDRRAAKKAARAALLHVTNYEQAYEESQEIALSKVALDVLPAISRGVDALRSLLDAMEDEENVLDTTEMLREIIGAFDEVLAGLPIS